MVDSLHLQLGKLLRHVAETAILPRFRCLAAHEQREKAPGETVTIADREAEAMLAEGLARLIPGARIVGEEAASADPALLDNLNDGDLWLVDPLDGTANFAAGNAPFGIMVALAGAGETRAAWLYDPLSGRLCHAEAGKGAYVDGERLTALAPPRARPVTALATQFLPEAARARVHAAAARSFDLAPIPRCAAEHYPRLALGQNDIALFQRTLPWDHAPGALFLTEAGGKLSRWDGSPYRFWDGRAGLIAATTPALWAQAMAVLTAPESGLASHAHRPLLAPVYPAAPVAGDNPC